MKTTYFIIAFIILGLCACNNKPKQVTQLQQTTNKRSVSEKPLSNTEFIKSLKPLNEEDVSDFSLNEDTLKIASADEFIFYPFGIFTDITHLNQANKFTIVKVFMRNTGTGEYIKVNKAKYLKSHINFFITENDSRYEGFRYEIISGEILDRGVVFNNGIQVGNTKKSVILKFFKQAPLNNVNVIVLESAITGMWQTYTFYDDKIKSISFKTDYTIE